MLIRGTAFYLYIQGVFISKKIVVEKYTMGNAKQIKES